VEISNLNTDLSLHYWQVMVFTLQVLFKYTSALKRNSETQFSQSVEQMDVVNDNEGSESVFEFMEVRLPASIIKCLCRRF